MASKKVKVHLDLEGNELQGAVVEPRTDDPSTTTDGRVYYNETDKRIKVRSDGSYKKLLLEGDTTTSSIEGATDTDISSPASGDLFLWNGVDKWENKAMGEAMTIDKDGKMEITSTAGTEIADDDKLLIYDESAGGYRRITKKNVVKDIEVGDLASGVLKTSLSGEIADDSTLPSAKASKEYTDAQISSAIEGLSWKDAVTACSTANVSISTGLESGDAIDGVTLSTGDRVLLKDQTDATENGVYVVVASGSASRSDDMNASAEFNGAVVPVKEGGTSNGGSTFRCTTVSPALGTTDIEFELFGADIPDATTTVKGKVELATATEAKARTDTTRATTPSSLADFIVTDDSSSTDGNIIVADGTTGKKTRQSSKSINSLVGKYSETFNSTTDWSGTGSYNISIASSTHGLGSINTLQVTVYEDGTPNEQVGCEVTVSDTGTVTIYSETKFAGYVIIVG